MKKILETLEERLGKLAHVLDPFFDRVIGFAEKYPNVSTALFVGVFLLFWLFFIASLAFSQNPERYLGFTRYESPTEVKGQIANLRVVDSGRMTEENLPFIALGGYTSPEGDKVGILTLIFSDGEFPKLIGVSGTHQTVDMDRAYTILDHYRVKLGAVRLYDAEGLPYIERTYANGTFTVGLSQVGYAQYTLITLMNWGDR